MIGLPPELHSIIIGSYPWPFGYAFCKIRTFVFEATTIASVLTILTFTFERWLHICKPMYAKKFSNGFKRAFKIIIALWLLSGILAAPFVIGTGAEPMIQGIDETILCKPLNEYDRLMTTLILLSTIILFIIPITLISIM